MGGVGAAAWAAWAPWRVAGAHAPQLMWKQWRCVISVRGASHSWPDDSSTAVIDGQPAGKWHGKGPAAPRRPPSTPATRRHPHWFAKKKLGKQLIVLVSAGRHDNNLTLELIWLLSRRARRRVDLRKRAWFVLDGHHWFCPCVCIHCQLLRLNLLPLVFLWLIRPIHFLSRLHFFIFFRYFILSYVAQPSGATEERQKSDRGATEERQRSDSGVTAERQRRDSGQWRDSGETAGAKPKAQLHRHIDTQ